MKKTKTRLAFEAAFKAIEDYANEQDVDITESHYHLGEAVMLACVAAQKHLPKNAPLTKLPLVVGSALNEAIWGDKMRDDCTGETVGGGIYAGFAHGLYRFKRLSSEE